MSIIVNTTLSDFIQGSSLTFHISCSINDVAVDISSDVLTFYIKDEDELIFSSSADVASSGSIGLAIFDISSSLTNLPKECYNYQFHWHTSLGKDYYTPITPINVLERISGSI